MTASIIFLLILAVLLVIFTIQNSVQITINFLFWKLSDVPLVLALLICLIIGVIMTMLFYYPKIWKLNSKIKEQQKQIDKLHNTHSPANNNPEGIEMTGDPVKGFFE